MSGDEGATAIREAPPSGAGPSGWRLNWLFRRDMRALRLPPGTDLRRTLEREARRPGNRAAFLIAGIGSLAGARLRPAGREIAPELEGDLEILTLAGSLSRQGVHVHVSVAEAYGRVHDGGHLLAGCIVRTTAELLIEALPRLRFARTRDPATGHRELAIHRARRRSG